ncbi:hypothetical protein SK066_07110 [Paenibacillus hunanensis]|uniref:hypothetical protein n=1 Tax=Paenibacillus hunanensis TaxID=539262 RepID=UPI002A6B489C|nr:hypothetical protein [Paenibacillus hunanensis]WPP42702.1 hypothetical protein SK066_07110 [Paenibacillus hunanensis]
MTIKRKLIRFALIIIILVGIVSQSSYLQGKVAYASIWIYLTLQQEHRSIVDIEYVAAFGNYIAVIVNDNGERSGISLSPSFFPVMIDYDSAHPPA